MNEMPRVVGRIKEIMVERGMSVHELSMATGRRIETLYRLLSGKTKRPSFDLIGDVAEGLGTTIDALRRA